MIVKAWLNLGFVRMLAGCVTMIIVAGACSGIFARAMSHIVLRGRRRARGLRRGRSRAVMIKTMGVSAGEKTMIEAVCKVRNMLILSLLRSSSISSVPDESRRARFFPKLPPPHPSSVYISLYIAGTQVCVHRMHACKKTKSFFLFGLFPPNTSSTDPFVMQKMVAMLF